MKAVKNTRFNDSFESGDTMKRGTKLAPNKKSGKDRHQLYQSLEEDDDEDFDDYRREDHLSTLDYIDDGDEFEDEFDESDDEFDEEFEE